MRSTSNPHQELVTKMYLFLDNELSKEAELELLKEIKSNPQYKVLFEKEKTFRDFIRSKIQRRKASSALIASLKEKINSALPSSVSPDFSE